MIATVALSFAACSDDDAGEQYLHESEVSITESNMNFTANEQSGYVIVKAPESLTAKTGASWAKATVNGDSVIVSVTANHKVEGRSTLLTVFSGTDSANVTIQQMGMSYSYNGNSYYIYNDSARTITLPVTNEGAEITVDAPDGFTYEMGDSGIVLGVDSNATGGIRTSDVIINAGPYKDTVQVIQGELKDVINKTYYFGAYDLAQSLSSTNIQDYFVTYQTMVLADTIAYGGSTYVIPYIYFPDEGWAISMEWDSDDLCSLLPGGILMGIYARRYYLYPAIVDASWFSALAQTDESYPALMASSYMYMIGAWGSNDTYGNVAEFYGASDNYSNWMGQLFNSSSLTSYDGSILGVFAFTNRLGDWVGSDGSVNTDNLSIYAGALHFFAYPMLIDASNIGSKPNVLPVGRRDHIQPTTFELQKSLSLIQNAKKVSGSQSSAVRFNQTIGTKQPSAFDYLSKVLKSNM